MYENRQYKTTDLKTLSDSFPEIEVEKRFALWTLYNRICSSWERLVDIRFKLLGFTPGVSILAIKSLSETEIITLKLSLSVLGLASTIAIWIYEKRNTQLHDDLISRGRKIEEELGIETGHFLGRLKTSKPFIKHDVALLIIYVSSILCWLVFLIYVLEAVQK